LGRQCDTLISAVDLMARSPPGHAGADAKVRDSEQMRHEFRKMVDTRDALLRAGALSWHGRRLLVRKAIAAWRESIAALEPVKIAENRARSNVKDVVHVDISGAVAFSAGSRWTSRRWRFYTNTRSGRA